MHLQIAHTINKTKLNMNFATEKWKIWIRNSLKHTHTKQQRQKRCLPSLTIKDRQIKSRYCFTVFHLSDWHKSLILELSSTIRVSLPYCLASVYFSEPFWRAIWQHLWTFTTHTLSLKSFTAIISYTNILTKMPNYVYYRHSSRFLGIVNIWT